MVTRIFWRKVIGISGICIPGIFYLLIERERERERERGNQPPPERSQLKRDHRGVVTVGKCKPTKARDYHNVIIRPFLNIMVKQICPPYLHILLGLVKKNHDILENRTHVIDLDIAEETAKSKIKLGQYCL